MFTVSLEKMVSNYSMSYVQDLSNRLIKSFSFETKKEANSFKRKLAKEYECVSYAGYLSNHDRFIEITTNY